MLVFCDVTELIEINQRYRNHYAAVGYVVIDNLEEIAQYVGVTRQAIGKYKDGITTPDINIFKRIVKF